MDRPDEPVYRLKAVSVHRGLTMKSGHYVTYVRENEGWVMFDNDECVTVRALKGIFTAIITIKGLH